MSWHTGMLFVQAPCGCNATECFHRLGIPCFQLGDTVPFDVASSPDLDGRAHALIAGWHVIIDPTMFFDLVNEPEAEGESVWPALLERSIQRSRLNAVGVLLDGTSGTYGYTRYDGGRRMRCLLIQEGEHLLDEGQPTAAEKDAFAADEDPEQVLLRLAVESTVGFAQLEAGLFAVVR